MQLVKNKADGIIRRKKQKKFEEQMQEQSQSVIDLDVKRIDLSENIATIKEGVD